MNEGKPEGVWLVKRKIRISIPEEKTDESALIHRLEALPGMKNADFNADKSTVTLSYDASVLDYLSIRSLLENEGMRPNTNWWSRLKGNWYQFTDTNARENANLPPPACCSKPPKKC